ncbi:MAG TPA: hypothetical protein DCP71_07370 [Verrucomicrobiales bacterium]|nr:hypothetical protein [Verrucomicrobiales bacterium]
MILKPFLCLDLKPEFPSVSVGFKEWAYVCDSLVQGVQSLILRKGGIHEGRGGFEWKHRQFFLFPTWFHTQSERLTWSPEGATSFPPEEERTSVDVDGFATLEQVWKVTDWAQMEAIASLHIWKEEIVKERFVYDDESCLHVALVRAYKLPERWSFPYSKSYGGCRSWVNLPAEGLDLAARALPALAGAAWGEYAAKLRAGLGGS